MHRMHPRIRSELGECHAAWEGGIERVARAQ
jgi:hypothetical protein